MAIYAYGSPHDDIKPFIYDSLVKQKISRFLWSWYHDCNLNRLKDVSWDSMSPDERESWRRGRRLLGFRPGDWVIHKHIPAHGKMTAARLSSEYFYQNPLPAPGKDGRQCFHVDKVFTFNRRDERVHPLFRAKLNVMGGLYQVYSEKEFYESLYELGYEFDDADCEAAKAVGANIYKNATQTAVEPSEPKSTAVEATLPLPQRPFLKSEFKQILGNLTEKIQHNNPGKDLERFLAAVFRNIPGVTEVKENGFGWKPDFGADLIVRYVSERIKGVAFKEETWVVQVKSFTGEHWETNAVNQLKLGIETFGADVGILITTGERTQILETAFDKLSEEMSQKNVDVYLVAGVEVAQFVLRYGLDLLI